MVYKLFLCTDSKCRAHINTFFAFNAVLFVHNSLIIQLQRTEYTDITAAPAPHPQLVIYLYRHSKNPLIQSY